MEKLRILLLANNAKDITSIKSILEHAEITFSLKTTPTQESFIHALSEKSFDLILVDYDLYKLNAHTALQLAQAKQAEAIFLLLLPNSIDTKKSLELLKAGVTDFIEKNSLQRLIPVISQLVVRIKEREKRRTAETALQASEAQYKALVSVSPTGIFKTDVKGEAITYTNEHIREIIGFPIDNLYSENWLRAIHPEDAQEAIKAWTESIRTGTGYNKEFRLRRPDGKDIWVMCRATPEKDAEGHITNYIGTLTDVTSLKNSAQKSPPLRRFDLLTDLPNQLLFEETLERIINDVKRSHENLALFFVNLDYFKNINDVLGFKKGDRLLQEAGKLLQKNARTQDLVARLGGDNFAIIIQDYPNKTNLLDMAQRIIEDFRHPINIDHEGIVSTVSIGIVTYPDGGDSRETLVQHADQALSQAKIKGRNNYKFYTQGMQQKAERQIAIKNHLQHAIKNQEFYLYYQPEINLKTNKMVGMEVLLRWHNSTLGEISPEEFIPIAEDSGIIKEISIWVLQKSLEQYQAWERILPAVKNNIKISINISTSLAPSQSLEQSFIQKIIKILKESQVNPENIVFELTETIIMKKIAEIKAILDALATLGITIAIDDFGIGYASLTYLKLLPIKILKIDKSFTQDIRKNLNSEAIIKAIIEFSNSLDLKVIAEGIETEEQLKFLKKHHCQIGQGYYFSQPISAEQMTIYIKNNL